MFSISHVQRQYPHTEGAFHEPGPCIAEHAAEVLICPRMLSASLINRFLSPYAVLNYCMLPFHCSGRMYCRKHDPIMQCIFPGINTTQLPGSNLTYDLLLGSAAAPQNQPYCYSQNRMPGFNLFCDLTGDFWMPGQQ